MATNFSNMVGLRVAGKGTFTLSGQALNQTLTINDAAITSSDFVIFRPVDTSATPTVTLYQVNNGSIVFHWTSLVPGSWDYQYITVAT